MTRLNRSAISNYLSLQGKRLIAGCMLGSVAAAAIHLFTRDSKFAPVVGGLRYFAEYFDGVPAYGIELSAFLALALVVVAYWARHFPGRFWRSWSHGGTSALPAAAFGITMVALDQTLPANALWAAGVALLTTCGLETWRWGLQQPSGVRPFDPITNEGQDLLGRGHVVEKLLYESLEVRTPVIALHGELGDGKSSVLNLLQPRLEARGAIVVMFKAWLPGSEGTLAHDLFRDIATECSKHVFLPRLRRNALAFARVIGGNVGWLEWLKDYLPRPSQLDEIRELSSTLSSVPRPIVVLVDEIDRMQAEEALVLFKILRGAEDFRNLTFICAFSEEKLRAVTGFSAKDFEKFFPVSIVLSPPTSQHLRGWLLGELCSYFGTSKDNGTRRWFWSDKEETYFREQFGSAWDSSLKQVCTNIRKGEILLRNVRSAGRELVGDVSPLDIVLVQTLRCFFPDVYSSIRNNQRHVTTTSKDTPPAQAAYLKDLEGLARNRPNGDAAFQLLRETFSCWPDNVADFIHFGLFRNDDPDDAVRVCDQLHFEAYVTNRLPNEAFSRAKLRQCLEVLDKNPRDSEVFEELLDPEGLNYRDLLNKVVGEAPRLSEAVVEALARAFAQQSHRFQYSFGWDSKEAEVILDLSGRRRNSQIPQRVIQAAVSKARHDTFALQVLAKTEEASKLERFSPPIDLDDLQLRFLDRMRARYGSREVLDLNQADWMAFRRWAEFSVTDAATVHDFFRQFIGDSGARLTQACRFIYPESGSWGHSPRDIVDLLFPLAELGPLLSTLPDVSPAPRDHHTRQRMLDLIQKDEFPKSPF